jgi:hypothetical protein
VRGGAVELRRQQCVRESERGESVRFLCLGLIVRFRYYRVSLLSKYGFGLRLG